MMSPLAEQNEVGNYECGIPLRRPALAVDEGFVLLGDTTRVVLGFLRAKWRGCSMDSPRRVMSCHFKSFRVMVIVWCPGD